MKRVPIGSAPHSVPSSSNPQVGGWWWTVVPVFPDGPPLVPGPIFPSSSSPRCPPTIPTASAAGSCIWMRPPSSPKLLVGADALTRLTSWSAQCHRVRPWSPTRTSGDAVQCPVGMASRNSSCPSGSALLLCQSQFQPLHGALLALLSPELLRRTHCTWPATTQAKS